MILLRKPPSLRLPPAASAVSHQGGNKQAPDETRPVAYLTLDHDHMTRSRFLAKQPEYLRCHPACGTWADDARCVCSPGDPMQNSWKIMQPLAGHHLAALSLMLAHRRDAVWDGLDVCPRTCICLSLNANLCTYETWFVRPAESMLGHFWSFRCHGDVCRGFCLPQWIVIGCLET